MKRQLYILLALMVGALFGVPFAFAQDQVQYTSQPDEIAVFLNDIAFVRDSISLPGGVDVQIALPGSILLESLIVRENGERVSGYRISQASGQSIVRWQSDGTDAVRVVALEYLINGVGWSPRYDMLLEGENPETVAFSFFGEIRNNAFSLDEIDVELVAGRVSTTQPIGDVTSVTQNQFIAGYEDAGAGADGVAAGSAEVQHVYAIGAVTAEPGERVYVRVVEAELPARRLLFWNAQTDNQVSVIYKVRNETDVPFVEGIVRTYQDGLFLGSDFVELTPVGGEGSVTIGNAQNVRVSRRQTVEQFERGSDDVTRFTVELSITSFSDGAVTIEVVDSYPAAAQSFEFSTGPPQREPGNLLRWEVDLTPEDNETTITYTYEVVDD